jgi:hypothetical protein
MKFQQNNHVSNHTFVDETATHVNTLDPHKFSDSIARNLHFPVKPKQVSVSN